MVSWTCGSGGAPRTGSHRHTPFHFRRRCAEHPGRSVRGWRHAAFILQCADTPPAVPPRGPMPTCGRVARSPARALHSPLPCRRHPSTHEGERAPLGCGLLALRQASQAKPQHEAIGRCVPQVRQTIGHASQAGGQAMQTVGHASQARQTVGQGSQARQTVDQGSQARQTIGQAPASV